MHETAHVVRTRGASARVGTRSGAYVEELRACVRRRGDGRSSELGRTAPLLSTCTRTSRRGSRMRRTTSRHAAVPPHHVHLQLRQVHNPFTTDGTDPSLVAFAHQDRRSPSLSPFSLSKTVFEPMFLMGKDARSNGQWKGTCFLSPFSLSRPVFEPMFLMGEDAGSNGRWKGRGFLSKGRERDTNRPRPWPT